MIGLIVISQTRTSTTIILYLEGKTYNNENFAQYCSVLPDTYAL